MKKLLRLTTFSLLSVILLFSAILPLKAVAQTEESTITNRMTSIAKLGGYVTGDAALTVPQIIGTVIRVALSFLGAIFIALIIMAGYRWMTASGNEEDIKKAKGTIKQAIIGLCITLFSYAIWVFIFQRLILNF
jgi:hypothetical protein